MLKDLQDKGLAHGRNTAVSPRGETGLSREEVATAIAGLTGRAPGHLGPAADLKAAVLALGPVPAMKTMMLAFWDGRLEEDDDGR